jgi:hypothetical protein
MPHENYTVGVRLQRLQLHEQALVLARLAQSRSQAGQFTPKDLESLFCSFALPPPTKISNIVAKLRKDSLLTQGNKASTWRMTPLGRQASLELLSDIDFAAFSAESASSSSALGQVAHTVVPPSLAPPSLIPGLHKFLEQHPFETNVFGMTRFPESDENELGPDPVIPALDTAREVCRLHGLQFHLASDRAIHDDLWTNVAAHMWASQYGIAFFEDRRKRGLNYNLTIEVGSMLITGRRCALLKDSSILRMPTDLVGKIYKSVDLAKGTTVSEALHLWIRDDLNLGSCPSCTK